MMVAHNIQPPVSSMFSNGNRARRPARAVQLKVIPTATPASAKSTVSRSTASTIYSFEAPMDFKIPISRVRSHTAAYMA